MRILNINVGVLGHVDSGKTSLAKALSTVASTSAFDKNPQSKKRGITLDLGFSSFFVDGKAASEINGEIQGYDKVQFALVDCPGHSSLIRTVLCGAQIIDLMLLVVDVTKGFQTQTAECLVIGSITCDQLVVVLNKCDLLQEGTRDAQIDKIKKRVLKTLELTKFSNAPISVVSAAPGGREVEFDANNNKNFTRQDIEDLIQVLLRTIRDPTERRQRVSRQEFVFAVDHCFSVTGQGTVMTGTVLAGKARVGENIELPYQRIQKKIKSIQMFHEPVDVIGPGDRAGICVPQLDPSLLERGLVGSPSEENLIPCHACILEDVKKIEYFKTAVTSKSRFHVFVGQDTASAKLTFFGHSPVSNVEDGSRSTVAKLEDSSVSYEYIEELQQDTDVRYDRVWVLLEFERPFICPKASLVIGARLDSTSTTACRLAFYGRVALQMTDPNYRQTTLSKLCVFRRKSRRGQVERVLDSRTCVVRGLFKRETNWDVFLGLRAYIVPDETKESTGNIKIAGRIESSFGQSGKCRMALDDELPAEWISQLGGKKGRKGGAESSGTFDGSRLKLAVVLEFRRHVFDKERRIMQ
ncbi:unnamed protein product [Calicophoron daubneyi]|uniref:Selenocysteine-specific elongation factor n=1 Tax=Calicophoron daubneyi TaxID=300641 RepID=A0AAV2TZX5_CALDB